jgi:hypothetical protein
MVNVQHISSRSEFPTGQNYVLVTYGEKSEQKKEFLGVTITVPHGTSMAMSDLSFTAALHSAKEIAKRENIPIVYACK